MFQIFCLHRPRFWYMRRGLSENAAFSAENQSAKSSGVLGSWYASQQKNQSPNVAAYSPFELQQPLSTSNHWQLFTFWFMNKRSLSAEILNHCCYSLENCLTFWIAIANAATTLSNDTMIVQHYFGFLSLSRKLNGHYDTASRNKVLYQEATNNSSTWWWHTRTPMLFQMEQVNLAWITASSESRLPNSMFSLYYATVTLTIFFQIRCVICVNLCIAKNSYFKLRGQDWQCGRSRGWGRFWTKSVQP